MPDSILIIPLLTTLLPVAWFSGFDISVEEVDHDFFNAVPDIREAFGNMYPKSILKGNIYAKKIIKNYSKKIRTAQLFSGGIDSIATYIRTQNENPILLTVWGADVKLNDIKSWEKVKNYNTYIAKELNTTSITIKSNLRELLDATSLGEEFGHQINLYHWWPGVQHGFGLLGLCAPISFDKGIHNLYIPASDNFRIDIPWGSHPSIDNNIKWAGTEVVHEGFDISRQEKIKVISKFIKEHKKDLQIRVCWQQGHNGGNCSSCEKCCRSMVGLIVENIDPNNHGFIVPKKLTQLVKNNIIYGNWSYSINDTMTDWQDIQAHIAPNIDNSTKYSDLLIWLKKFNFNKRKHSLFLKFRVRISRYFPIRFNS